MEIALKAVSGSLYNEKFMSELQAIVDTGDTTAAAAEKLITTAEDKTCARTGNNNSGSMSGVSQPATSRNSPSAASSASAALFNSQSRNVSRAVPVSFSSSFTTAPFGQQQMQPAAASSAPAAASSAPAALFRSQSNNFRYAVPVDMTAQKVTGKRKPINNGRGNNGVAMPISNNSNVRSVRPRYTARRTTNATPGGSHRNHRTRKQKKNKKTRKNKKLTKRI